MDIQMMFAITGDDIARPPLDSEVNAQGRRAPHDFHGTMLNDVLSAKHMAMNV